MRTRICVNCEVAYKPEENGVLVIELFQSDREIYKIWYADLQKCPGCGNEIIAGFADQPLAEHYQKEAMERANEIHLAHKKAGKRVVYWRENPKSVIHQIKS